MVIFITTLSDDN